MTDTYLGEIRLFSYSRIPSGWTLCDGRSLPVTGNQALYSLIGNQFGGDTKNFNLPDLRGATIVGALAQTGFPATIGARGGKETITLTTDQIPPHTHTLFAVDANATGGPSNGFFAKPIVNPAVPAPQPAPPPVYGPTPTAANQMTPLNSFATTMTGGGGPHENRQPFLTLVYAICTSGLYPMRP